MKRKLTLTAIVLLIAMAFTTVAFAAGTSVATATVSTSLTRNPAYGSYVISSSGINVKGYLTGTNASFSSGTMTVAMQKKTPSVTNVGTITVSAGGSKRGADIDLVANTYYRVKTTLNTNSGAGDAEGTGRAYIG